MAVLPGSADGGPVLTARRSPLTAAVARPRDPSRDIIKPATDTLPDPHTGMVCIAPRAYSGSEPSQGSCTFGCPRAGLPRWVINVHGRQVFHLVSGEAEMDEESPDLGHSTGSG